MEHTPQAPALQINHLSCSWDSGRKALDDVSLCIEDNEFIAIAGENGAGKTTLLHAITGLLRPAGGEILIRGRDARRMSIAAIAAEVGYLMQNPDRQLFSATVYDEAAFALKNAGLPQPEIDRRVQAALAAAGLSCPPETFPPALGRGERARVAIAAALAMGSRILLLDEPTAGQDYKNSLRIMDTLRELHRNGRTIIFVTHAMSIAAEYARRILVMKAGHIHLDGQPAAVFSRFAELAAAGVLPPPAALLSGELRSCGIPLAKNALTAAELGDALLALKK
jgi:energy-coupling factor transport system ATP-binding protein